MPSLSIGIYKKQLYFFIVVGLILTGTLYLIKNQFSSASINDAVNSTSGYSKNNLVLEITSEGKTLVNGKMVTQLLQQKKEFDQLKYIAFEGEGRYVASLVVNVHLPKEVRTGQFSQKVYAVHGVGSYNFYQTDPQTLVYSAENLAPSATFTIEANLPKGLVSFPWYERIWFYLTNLSFGIWLAISLVFVVITLFFLIYMFRQGVADWNIMEPKEEICSPPGGLSPALAGVIIEGQVAARTIAAILFDLANRNYIYIIGRRQDYTFGKRRPIDLTGQTRKDDLADFERVLLSKIFTPEALKSTTKDIKVRIGRHVFSRKIAIVYSDIYQHITGMGYFLENPNRIYTQYKTAGTIFFLLSILGFIFGIWLAPDPKYPLIFWFTVMITSIIIIKMSPHIPARTSEGRKALIEWLKFRRYLTNYTPFSYEVGAQETFEKYLPYAIAFGCEVEWANRFINLPFRNPDWFSSARPVAILEDFVNSLFPVISKIGEELSAAREPEAPKT